MTHDKLNGRTLHLWRGRNPAEDTVELAQAIAKSPAELFNDKGQLVYPNGGHLSPVSKERLLAFITEHIVTRRVVNRGTAEAPIQECEYCSFGFHPGMDLSLGPNDRVLMTLLTGRALERMPPGSSGNEFERGSVAWWVPKV